MIDIREHGGPFGGSKKLKIKLEKAIKQIYALPMTVGMGGSTSITHTTETKTYIWYSATIQGSNFIARMGKKDPMDLKFYSRNAEVVAFVPLYETDKLVIIYNTNTLLILDANFSEVYVNYSFISTAANSLISYYYKEATKILYVAIRLGSYTCLVAINLNTITAPVKLYEVQIQYASSNYYGGFDPVSDNFRYFNGGSAGYYFNKVYSLSNGAILETLPNPVNSAAYAKKTFGNSYDTTMCVDNNGITKYNIRTDAVLSNKTLATLKTDIQSILTSQYGLTVAFDSIHSSVKKLPNGNYVAAISIRTVGLSGMSYQPSGTLLFIFNEDLQITGVENSFNQLTNGINKDATDLNDNEKRIVGSGYEPEIFIF